MSQSSSATSIFATSFFVMYSRVGVFFGDVLFFEWIVAEALDVRLGL